MKIGYVIARILLGLTFLVFGLNGFYHFLPAPPLSGLAGQFFTLLVVSKYYVLIFAVQLIGGVMLLANRYVPLALVILGPVIVNVLCFHIFMNPAGLPLAVVTSALWLVLAVRDRGHFAGIFERRV
ncbi:MAG: hypothetical protein NVS1B11_17430 [Terriglobales bacterium]